MKQYLKALQYCYESGIDVESIIIEAWGEAVAEVVFWWIYDISNLFKQK